MKKTKFVKFATLITVFAMLVGVMAGVSFVANAEEEVGADPVFSIGMKNLVYEKYFHIALTVENAPADADIGIAVFEQGKAPETAEPLYLSLTEYYDGDVTYYVTKGIEARAINAQLAIYPVAVTAEGNEYGAALEYSVFDYCNERLDEDVISDAQKTLYNAVIAYGKAAGAVLPKN